MGTEITVVARDGTVRDRGESGELVVSGPTVTPGYYGDSEATDEKFGDHGLHTGDIGYIDKDGYVHVLNRLDDRIISGGENIQPGEVATVLTDHPQVKDAAVVGIDDEEWGQRVGAQVARVTDELDAASLLSFAQQRLARFKLPRTLSFDGPIQRTASGTIDRPAVRDHLSTHGFQPGRSLRSREKTDLNRLPRDRLPRLSVRTATVPVPTEA
jgi:Acyl-CoA synthetases (AMP-forming)/AMP-acid ligases II